MSKLDVEVEVHSEDAAQARTVKKLIDNSHERLEHAMVRAVNGELETIIRMVVPGYRTKATRVIWEE